MSNEELIPTRASLLNRLKDWGDNDSWQEFNDTYRHLLYHKVRNAGLTDAEAQDVVQDTLLSVARQMPGFRYDPAVASFKTWLHQVVTRRIADHFRRRGRQVRVAEPPLSDTGTAALERFADPADPALDALWDKEWEETLCAAAQRRVRRKASPEQFQIYEYHVLRGHSVKETAHDLGLTENQVHLAKHRIGLMLKTEIEYLQTKPL
jgi:RNA polymerase sigma-70 factor (ECF subfamily)